MAARPRRLLGCSQPSPAAKPAPELQMSLCFLLPRGGGEGGHAATDHSNLDRPEGTHQPPGPSGGEPARSHCMRYWLISVSVGHNRMSPGRILHRRQPRWRHTAKSRAVKCQELLCFRSKAGGLSGGTAELKRVDLLMADLL